MQRVSRVAGPLHVGTVTSYCLLLDWPRGLGLKVCLEVDRLCDPFAACLLGVGVEVNEPATAGTTSRSHVMVFDPVVDDVGADVEHGGYLCHSELVVGRRLGGIGTGDVY